MNRFLQRLSTRAGDRERAREGISGTDGTRGDDLRRSDIQDSARSDGEREIAATGNDHLTTSGSISQQCRQG